MIQVIDVRKAFGARVLFENVRFSVNAGEKIGLVGRNGQGKTTLFSLIAGRQEPDAGAVVVPRLYRIGYLDQRLRFSEQTALEEACRGLPAHERGEHWRAEKILQGLGFAPPDLRAPPQRFSGGFQVRIQLAKLLLSQPHLLLLDEPNNYLDVVAIRWLVRFLQEWKGELLLITHDRRFMDSVCTHILGIHRAQVRKIGGKTARYYAQVAQDEQVYERTRRRDERKRREAEEFISRFRAKARQAGLAQSRLKMLEKRQAKEKLADIETMDFYFPAAPFAAPVMLHLDAVAFGYPGSVQPLFSQVSFSVGQRERIGVIGRNGKGKSTFLRLLAGELAPSAGSIRFHSELRKGVFAQAQVDFLREDATVLEEISSADPDADARRARAICAMLMFRQDEALKPVRVLSGGERSRVALGKILMQACHLLLLDEPTNHLDMESSEALVEAIKDFSGSVVMVTHNEYLLDAAAERLLVFDDDGVRWFEGTYREFLAQVGWRSEESIAAVKSPEEERSARDGDKQRRANLRQERSRCLKPREERIHQVEEKIAALEEAQRQTTRALIEASQRGDAAAIAETARRHKELPVQIDEQYEILDRLTQEFEAAQADFVRKFAELDSDGAPARV
ncbi:MAG: ATP-binding cassette domain-containing protein [Candidatus Omnitrophica bacterium]|nr:ATP-binding cassette domain-containing protein [Candidatus Omnitrophota bacterium]